MKYTMKDFIEKPIAVRLKKENAESFLVECDKNGISWHYGGSAIRGIHIIADAVTRLIEPAVFFIRSENAVNWDDVRYCVKKGLLIADFEDIDLGEAVPSSPYRITIDCDGKTTTVRMIINGKEIKSATARCNPADKFNFKFGATVALNRLFSREPKANDYDKFRIGDRVVCDYVVSNPLVYNKHGKILKRNNDFAPFNYAVEFDDDICGHDAGGRGQAGHCWSINEDKLRRE